MASAMSRRTRSSKRSKWTEQMNIDILDCKRKAQELVASNNPPVNKNGRQKGYIKVMQELWESRGYGYLGLKSQNLRDQAARLEKEVIAPSLRNDGNGIAATRENSKENTDTQHTAEGNTAAMARGDGIANLITHANLHETASGPDSENGNESQSQCADMGNGAGIQSEDNASEQWANYLPEYKSINIPHEFHWNRLSDGRTITVKTSTINNAYEEIAHWRKNTFLVPYGRTGKEFIERIAEHVNDWNSESEAQHIALKAAIVLLAVGLQKPSRKSKAKQHKECLAKRLAQWNEGEIDKLMREGRMIQKKLTNSPRRDAPDKAKIFANLVMNGQINSALRYLSDNECGGVLPLSDDVMRQLKEKHPVAQEACLGSLLFGPIEDIPDVAYQQIDGAMVRDAALNTKGSGGPSGVDAKGFKRMLGCKSFKKSGTQLCDAIAEMCRRLCTTHVDPHSIEALMASRLIPLDKGEGAVRPIGVGEVMRRIIGKCVMKVTKPDVIDACGSLQVCAGLKSGSEAAIHAMRSIFDADETDAVLLIDASNAFNTLNRAAALHNVRVICPSIATFAINTYRQAGRLFVIGGQEMRSAEGTTQGDPLAMSLYAIALQPLISHLQFTSEAKQCWFADDAAGCGLLADVKKWWNELLVNGPALGYFPNAKKCWLITKPEKESAAREIFGDTAVNISTDGHKHLGAALGSQAYLEEYVGEKVQDWIQQILKLAEFAMSQPQASYAALTFGLRHRWTYFLRTLPDITDLLEPLERAITDILIPAITDHRITEVERDLLALPVRMGGLGIPDVTKTASSEYETSRKVTANLTMKIIEQTNELPDPYEVREVQLQERRKKGETLTTNQEEVKRSLPLGTARAVELAGEKGASNWLTVLPIEDQGYNLNKQEFRDAIKLRYNWEISDIPKTCVCGDHFDIDHAMICRRGGFVIQRHNELRDLEAELLNMVCNDVEVEPVLQELTGETLQRGTNKAPDARLDIHARGFWERQRAAFFDVRVCHPNADSYRDQEPKQIYKQHENEKKRQYASRVMEVEQGTFTPLVFSSTGGMADECIRFHNRLAELLALKKGEDYASVVSWIRAKVSFALIRSALLCLRGSRSVRRTVDINNLDIDVENREANIIRHF